MSDDLCWIRCVTCGKVLANKWESYQKMLEDGVRIEVALNELGLRRPCCRIRMMNPIKVVDRNVQTQSDITKQFENNFETLSISTDSSANAGGALTDITSVSSFTIMPEEETDIELPPIPIIRKTSAASSGNNIFRSYTAW